MNSIWSETIELPHFSSLNEDVKTDVLIIGGGITGILCAYFLQKAGVDYILVEGKKICSGVTKNTTAKITSQHGLLYHKLLERFDLEYARKYLEINQMALEKYRQLCEGMDCDFEGKSSYVYSLNDKRKLEKEMKALDKIGFQAILNKTWELPFQTAGAVMFLDQAQFHPLKFIQNIAAGMHIYENTFVTEITPHLAKTTQGNIIFDKAVFATHFPIDNKHGMYFLKMYQNRSYVISLQNGPNLKGMYVDEAEKGMSFRTHSSEQGVSFIIGGGDHRTGKRGRNWTELRDFATRYYPNLKEEYYWAAQDCMTLDEVPYIGPYASKMPGCYVATGFNKWGITSSMVSAMLLTDMILGKENEFSEIFHPNRTMMRKQLFINAGESAMNLLSFSKRRCPHLGCALKWNKDEHSWDCPCHGSRFNENGKVLDNPANGNAHWK